MGSYYAKTHILKDYEERRYPSVNQACTEVKYKMPELEDEDVLEEKDGDVGDGNFEKMLELMWMGISKKNNTKLEDNMEIMDKPLKYFSGVNKKDQEMESTSPIIFTMKRKKVSYIY